MAVAAVIGALRVNLGMDASSFNAAAQQAILASRQLAQSMSVMFEGAMARGGGLQNTARQLTDIAVQLQMSTPIMMVMSQQLPQLISGFGVWGEVIGAIVAGGFFAWTQLAGEGTKALKDTTNELSEAFANLKKAQEEAGKSLEDLTLEYGENAIAAERLLDLQESMAQLKAIDKMVANVQSVAAVFGDLNSKVNNFQQVLDQATSQGYDFRANFEALIGMKAPEDAGGLGNWVTILQEIQDSLHVTQEAAVPVFQAFVDLTNAKGPEEQAAAMQALAGAMILAADNGGTLDESMQELISSLLEAAREAYATAAAARSAGDAAEISGIQASGASAGWYAYGAAIRSANAARAEEAQATFHRLRTSGLERSRDAEQKLLDKTVDAHHQMTAMINDDLRQRKEAEDRHLKGFTDYIDKTIDEQDRLAKEAERAAKKGGGGKSDEEREMERLQSRAEALALEMRTPVEVYSDAIAEANLLWQKGFINIETFKRLNADAATDFNETMKDLSTVAEVTGEDIKDAFTNAFSDLLQGTASFAETMSRILSNIGSQFIEAGLSNLFNTFWPGQPAHLAGGTNFFGGGLAWVGERGRELVNLPTGSQVISNKNLGALGGGATIRVDLGPDLVGRIVEQNQAQTIQLMGAYDHSLNRSMPSRVNSVARDPRRR